MQRVDAHSAFRALPAAVREEPGPSARSAHGTMEALPSLCASIIQRDLKLCNRQFLDGA